MSDKSLQGGHTCNSSHLHTHTQVCTHTQTDTQTHKHLFLSTPTQIHLVEQSDLVLPKPFSHPQYTHTHGYMHPRTHSCTHSAALSAGSQQACSLSGPVKWLAQHCALLPHLFTVRLLTQPYLSYAALMIERLAKDSRSSWSCHQEIKMQNFQDAQCSLEEPRNIWLTDNVSTLKCMIVMHDVHERSSRQRQAQALALASVKNMKLHCVLSFSLYTLHFIIWAL